MFWIEGAEIEYSGGSSRLSITIQCMFESKIEGDGMRWDEMVDREVK